MALPNYVKFLRGTIASYNRLAVKDENTLYFVYQDGDESKGKLYLGSRLISGEIGAGLTTLADLTDVIVDGADAGSFLVLNSDGNWVATSASDIAQTILEAGGSFINIDENEFELHPVTGNLQIKGYNSASSGMIPVKNTNGIIWQNAPIDLSPRVGTLEGKVSNLETGLQAVDGKISAAIAGANHLTYEVVTNLNDAININTVYLHSNNRNEANNAYDEYMVINGTLEKIGQFGANLSNYVTVTNLNEALANKVDTSTFQSVTNGLQNTINNLGDTYVTKTEFNNKVGNLSALTSYNNLNYDNNASISDTLIDIYEHLIWQQMSG